MKYFILLISVPLILISVIVLSHISSQPQLPTGTTIYSLSPSIIKVKKDNATIFEIQDNGDIYSDGKKIGTNKLAADTLREKFNNLFNY